DFSEGEAGRGEEFPPPQLAPVLLCLDYGPLDCPRLKRLLTLPTGLVAIYDLEGFSFAAISRGLRTPVEVGHALAPMDHGQAPLAIIRVHQGIASWCHGPGGCNLAGPFL